MDDYLSKPISQSKLDLILTKWLPDNAASTLQQLHLVKSA